MANIKNITIMEDKDIAKGIAADADAAPVLTDNDFMHAMTVEQLPASARKAVAGVRGKQYKPIKVSKTIRLPAEVVAYFEASGKGWQTRLGNVLSEYVERHKV